MYLLKPLGVDASPRAGRTVVVIAVALVEVAVVPPRRWAPSFPGVGAVPATVPRGWGWPRRLACLADIAAATPRLRLLRPEDELLAAEAADGLFKSALDVGVALDVTRRHCIVEDLHCDPG